VILQSAANTPAGGGLKRRPRSRWNKPYRYDHCSLKTSKELVNAKNRLKKLTAAQKAISEPWSAFKKAL
jgi:hypothetical protein